MWFVLMKGTTLALQEPPRLGSYRCWSRTVTGYWTGLKKKALPLPHNSHIDKTLRYVKFLYRIYLRLV